MCVCPHHRGGSLTRWPQAGRFPSVQGRHERGRGNLSHMSCWWQGLDELINSVWSDLTHTAEGGRHKAALQLMFSKLVGITTLGWWGVEVSGPTPALQRQPLSIAAPITFVLSCLCIFYTMLGKKLNVTFFPGILLHIEKTILVLIWFVFTNPLSNNISSVCTVE